MSRLRIVCKAPPPPPRAAGAFAPWRHVEVTTLDVGRPHPVTNITRVAWWEARK